MQRQEKYDLIQNTKGKIFSVLFEKKDKSLREMVCRLGVTKHLAGGENTLAGHEQYVTVFDMQKEAYRAINLDTLKKIKVSGTEYYFEGDAE